MNATASDLESAAKDLGLTTDAQKAEMKEARTQLEEFDKQLATMSPQERQTVENKMGGQMDTVRSMANGGVLQYVEIIDEINVNTDLKVLFGSGQSFPPDANLLQRIQTSLQTPGYAPGNIDGVMDTLTSVAQPGGRPGPARTRPGGDRTVRRVC